LTTDAQQSEIDSTSSDSTSGLVGKGILGLLDQGIVSAGNFLTTLFLARRLPIETFGTYFTLFQLLLVLNNLHDSLVTYPLNVRGAKTEGERFRRLLGAGAIATLLLGFFWSVAIVVGVVATDTLTIAPWIIGAMVCWQMQELLRRSLMAQHRFDAPILGDAVSFLGQALAVFLLIRDTSDLRLVFAIMAITSLAGAAIQFFQTRPAASSMQDVREFLSTGWNLGRWLLLNNLLGMINIQVAVWTVGYFHKEAAVALLGAVSSVLGITHPALMGLTRMLVPSVARAAHEHGRKAAIRVAATIAGFGAAALLPIYLCIALFSSFVLNLFYKEKYLHAVVQLRLVVLVYVIDYVGRMIESTLNGLEENRAASVANIAAATITVIVALPLIYFYSVNGAIIGGCFSVLARQVVGLYYLRRSITAA
jgi:O-antigen/teichoic acid export membrane protein